MQKTKATMTSSNNILNNLEQWGENASVQQFGLYIFRDMRFGFLYIIDKEILHANGGKIGRLPCLTWSRGKAEKHWRERKLIPASSLVLFGARFNGSKIDHWEAFYLAKKGNFPLFKTL